MDNACQILCIRMWRGAGGCNGYAWFAELASSGGIFL
jgi:hypothetical protein